MAYATVSHAAIALSALREKLGVKTIMFSPSISTGTGRLEITEKDGFCYYYELPDCNEETVLNKCEELLIANEERVNNGNNRRSGISL